MTIYTKGTFGSEVITTDQLNPTFGQKFDAAFDEAALNLPTVVIGQALTSRGINLADRYSAISDPFKPAAPEPIKLNQDQVNAKIAASGLKEKQLKLKGNTYTADGVDAIIERKKQLLVAEDVASRTNWDAGSVVRGAVSFGVSMADPTNLALAYFPAGKLANLLKFSWAEKQLAELAVKGATAETLLGRTAARVGLGTVEGTVGTTLLEPAYNYARNVLGDDYTMVSSLGNILAGAGFGGVLHGAIGGIGDVLRGRIKSEARQLDQVYGVNNKVSELINSENPRLNNLGISLDDATQKIIPIVKEMSEHQKALDIRDDLNRALNVYESLTQKNLEIRDILNDPAIGEYLNSSEIKLLDFIDQNINHPRIISEGLSNYYNELKNVGEDNILTKDDILSKAFDIQKTPEEVAASVSPQTREEVGQTAVAQMADGKVPDIEALLNSDPAIGKASFEEVKEALEKANSVENEYIVKDVEKLGLVDPEYVPQIGDIENISIADTNTAKLKRETDFQLAQLKAEGLYSRDTTILSPTIADVDYVKTITDAVRKSFGASTDRLLKDSRINVVNSVAELPGKNHPNDVQAYTKDGKVYVVASNVTPEQVQGIVLHEVAAHAGMKKILGKEGYNDIFRQIDRLLKEGDTHVELARNSVPKDTPKEHIREETLGYMFEYAPEHDLVQKFVSKVKAWFYKTFPSLRDKINLSYADIVSLGKSILKDYSKTEYEAIKSDGLYSRKNFISEEELHSFREEINAFQAAEEKVELYGNALRKVTIGDANTAINVIKEETKLSTAEAEKMYKEMVRKVNTYENQQLRGDVPEWAQGLDPQERAIQNMMATQLQDIAVKRRARVFDQRAYYNAVKRVVDQYMTVNDNHPINDQQDEGIKSLLVGSILRRDGSGISVASMQQLYSKQLFADLYTQLKKEGLYDLFRKDKDGIQKDAMRAQLRKQAGQDYGNLSPEAIKIGEIISSVYDKALQMRNEKGTWIRKNNQFIMDNSYLHDQFIMVKTSFDEWKKDALINYDLQKMADNQNISVKQVENELREIYEGLLSGNHKKYSDNMEAEQLSAMFGAPNIAKKTAKSRVIYFKNEDAQINYFNKYSGMSYYEAVGHTLEKSAKQAGILEMLGANYETTLNKILETVQREIIDPKQKAKFNDTMRSAQDMLEYLDGRANIPANATMARVAANVRSISRMSTVGASAVSSATDFITHAAAIKYSGGDGFLTAVPKAIMEMLTPYKGTERVEILEQMGLISDGIRSQVYDYSGAQDIGRTLQSMERWFYKFNAQNYMSHKMALVSGDALANNLARYATKSDYAKLPKTLKGALSKYNILEPEWNLLRKAEITAADGRNYLVPEGLNNLTNEIKAQIKQQNRTMADGEINIVADRKLQQLKDNLQMYYLNTISDEIIGNPTARNAFWLRRGAKKGTAAGEAWNAITQLKMWPTWFAQNVLGREIYGRGYDTFGQYIKNGKGDIFGGVQLILGMTMGGAVSDTIKSMLRGQKPKDYSTVGAWGAAFSQGGGLGIYGDFIYGTENRIGHSPLGTALGPIFGNLEDAFRIYNIIKDPNSSERTINNVPGQLFNLAIKNVPFNNLFWAKQALNYMLIYNIQEHLNPGYLSRMQRRAEELEQPYFIPPTKALGQ